MARFRLLRGRHIEAGVTYLKNQIIKTDYDLTKLNGPGSFKFEPLPDAKPTLEDDEDEDDAEDPVDLTKKTKAQLKALLETRGVEYASDDTKEELIARFEDVAAEEAE